MKQNRLARFRDQVTVEHVFTRRRSDCWLVPPVKLRANPWANLTTMLAVGAMPGVHAQMGERSPIATKNWALTGPNRLNQSQLAGGSRRSGLARETFVSVPVPKENSGGCRRDAAGCSLAARARNKPPTRDSAGLGIGHAGNCLLAAR